MNVDKGVGRRSRLAGANFLERFVEAGQVFGRSAGRFPPFQFWVTKELLRGIQIVLIQEVSLLSTLDTKILITELLIVVVVIQRRFPKAAVLHQLEAMKSFYYVLPLPMVKADVFQVELREFRKAKEEQTNQLAIRERQGIQIKSREMGKTHCADWSKDLGERIQFLV